MNNFDNFPLLGQFKNKLVGDFITTGLIEQIDLLAERYGGEYLNLAERVLSMLEKMDYDTFFIAQQYIFDYLKQMSIFLKTGNYGHEDYNEIKETIYDSADIMMKTYMPGLFLAYANTTILYTKYNLFRNKFLPLISSASNGIGIEVGFGEGFYLWELNHHAPHLRFDGFDISEHAVAFASSLFDYANMQRDRYRLQIGDITSGIPASVGDYDFGILAEVIEHIPNPEQSITEMARLIRPGGYLYLTSVIDSNHMDHITNFESPDIVESMIKIAGFNILHESTYRIQDDFKKSKDISVGLAFVCKRRE